MLRLLFAFAVTCAFLTPALAEDPAPAPQVVIVPGEETSPVALPQSTVTEEAAISVPEAKATGAPGGCRSHASTVYLTN